MPFADPAARRARLHAIGRAYVTEGLGKKNFDAIPYDDNVTLRAPLAPGGVNAPLKGKENLRARWWQPLPAILGKVQVLDSYINEDLTAVACEFLVDVLNPPCTLRILDRFMVDEKGRIIDQCNYFDPRDATNPGWNQG